MILLFLATLSGPPAPDVDLLHHFKTGASARGTQLHIHLPLQALAAAADLWTTKRCVDAGTCYEANPLSDGVPYALKGATFAVIAGLTVWAEKTDRRGLAWTITALSVVVQGVLAIRNLRFGGETK